MEFFRHCPGCGRRFHIRLEKKSLVEHTEAKVRSKREVTAATGGYFTGASPPVFIVQEGRPIIMDIEEFQYKYKCGHCGHEWAEIRFKERPET